MRHEITVTHYPSKLSGGVCSAGSVTVTAESDHPVMVSQALLRAMDEFHRDLLPHGGRVIVRGLGREVVCETTSVLSTVAEKLTGTFDPAEA